MGLIIATIVFAGLYVWQRSPQGSVLALLLKIITTSLLISFCFKIINITPSFYLGFPVLFMLAMVFSLFGDIFLDLKLIVPAKKSSFLTLGILFFTAAQSFFVTAFISQTEIYYQVFILALAIGFTGYLISVYVFKYKMEGFALLVTIYSSLVISVAIQAAIYANQNNWLIVPSVFFVASLVFLLSDFLLWAVLFADKNSKAFVVGVHFTYYLAQILYVLGAYNFVINLNN